MMNGSMLVAVNAGDAAAWATAVGTLFLATAAVGVAWWSHRNELEQQRLRAWEAARDRTITDLDETRRLLVIIIHRPDSLDSADLFGTVVHALAWHTALVDPDRAADMLVRWKRDGSGRDELDEIIEILVRKMTYLRQLEPLGPLLLDSI